jgi:hypothetical protein
VKQAPAGKRPVPPKGRGKLPWLIGAAVFLVAAVAGGLIIALNGGDKPVGGHAFAQYDYRFVAPPDWAQTGDNVADKQVVIRPADAQTGDDLVVVQEFSMDFDATADRQRLVDYLKGLAQQDPAYSNFTSNAVRRQDCHLLPADQGSGQARLVCLRAGQDPGPRRLPVRRCRTGTAGERRLRTGRAHAGDRELKIERAKRPGSDDDDEDLSPARIMIRGD